MLSASFSRLTTHRVLSPPGQVLTYPIAIFVCRQALHALLHPARASRPDVRLVPRRRHLAYTLALFGSSVAITMGVTDLGAVMAVTGNVAGALLGFVLPGLIALSPAAREGAARDAGKPAGVARTRREAVGPLALVAFGVVSAVLGVASIFFPNDD